MEESKLVMSPMVPGFKVGKNEESNRIGDTYYKLLVGSLMYITATRTNIIFGVSFISRFMLRSTKLNLQVLREC